MKHHARGRLAALLLLPSLLLLTGCTPGISTAEGWASPVSDGSRLYAQLDRGVLTAFRLSDGAVQRQWRYPAENDKVKLGALYARPIVDRGTIFLVAHSGLVVALDANTGRPLESWRGGPVDLQATLVATPGYDGRRLYVATEKGDLFAVDAATGASTHLSAGNGRIWSGIALRDGVVYLGNLDGRRVRAVDAETGALRWEQSLAGAAIADLQISDRVLIVGSLDRALHALDMNEGGEQRWRFSGDGWFAATPLIAGGTIYAATLRGSVYAIDPATGEQRWRFKREGVAFRGRPIIAGGTLIVVGRKGDVFGLDPATGVQRWHQVAADAKIDADPILVDGELLLMTTKGELVRLAPDSGTLRRLGGAS